MKKVNLLLQQAMMRTVDLEPLSERIFCKYQKYIDDKVKQLAKVTLIPKSSLIPENQKIRIGARDQHPQSNEEQEYAGRVGAEESKHPEVTRSFESD